MIQPTSWDADFADRLPLPLAQLYCRAFNAKTPLERHLTAYYLWEAGLKLLGSVAVVEYAALDHRDDDLARMLHNLARPATGHWWQFVRRLVPVLADAGDRAFIELRDALFGGTRQDLPRAAGLDAALKEILDGTKSQQASVRPAELFDRLVRYRNKYIGHGVVGALGNEFYDRMARSMMAGVTDLFRHVDVTAGRRMIYVADVRQLSNGAWLVERFELLGREALPVESLELRETRIDRLPRTGRLYLLEPAAAVQPAAESAEAGAGSPAVTTAVQPPVAVGSQLLHPLLTYDAVADEVFFLNGRQGKRRAEYLGYTSGDNRHEVLAADQRELLARVLGAEVDEQTLQQWAENSIDDGPTPSLPPERAEPKRLGEFELVARIGRGGMGTVYRAWQPSLGRLVAVKRLLKAGDDKAQQRFQREIRALGRVEHPHLVKIFTDGADGDEYFYAMELIEGAELSDVCLQLQHTAASEVGDVQWQHAVSSACHEVRKREKPLTETAGTRDGGSTEAEAPADQPAADDVADEPESEPGRAAQPAARGGRSHVRRVVEIVRQVAEAAHALHEKGVVHRDIKPGNVMLNEQEHAVLMDLGLAQLTDETERRVTQTRQFVGTLRYASPEQVLSAGRLDRRSDVYSLGATLWELLTLKPLYQATDATPAPDLMLAIQQTEPERPRRLNPHVPVDLQAIVLKCLEKDRKRRYATAAELADDLARWQNGEPVLAQPPSLKYLLGKSLRRHRYRLAAAAALMLLAVIGLAVAFWQISAARDEALTAKDQAVAAKDEALAAKSALEAALGREQTQRRRANANADRAETAQGKAVESAELAEQNAKLAEQQSELVLETLNSVIFDIQRQLENVPAAFHVRRSLLETALEGLQRVSASLALRSRVDRNVAAAHVGLGDVFLRVGGEPGIGATEAALREYERAHEILSKLAADNPRDAQAKRDLAVSYNKLGDVTLQLGQTEAALKHYKRDLEITQRLAADNPRDAQAQRDMTISYNKLGDVSLQLGQTEAAREYYKQGLVIRERLATDNLRDAQAQRDLSVSYNKLGDVTLRLGQTEAAPEYYKKGLAIAQRLAANNPRDAQAQRDLSVSYNNLGDVTLKLGQTETAMEYFKQGLEIRERLAADNPRDAKAQRDLSISYNNLGDVTLHLGQTAAGLSHYKQGLEIVQRLAADNPRDAQARRDLSISYNKLGDATLKLGQTDAALDYCKVGLEIAQRLAADNPHDAQAQRDLSVSYNKLGDVSLQLGQPEVALEYYEQDLEIAKRLATDSPRNPQAQRDVSYSFNALAWTLATCPDKGVRNGKQAVEYATKACELTNEEDANCLDTLAAAYAEAGDFDKAVQWQTKALAQADDFAEEEKVAMKQRLELYKANKPYHEPVPEN